MDALPLAGDLTPGDLFPPFYIGYRGPATDLSSLVYLAFRAITRFFPLHQTVNCKVHRLSLSFLHATDHVSWTSHLFCKTPENKTHARPKSRGVLLMVVLRAIWVYQAFLADTSLVIHIPGPSMVKSLRSPPSAFSTEVTESGCAPRSSYFSLSPLVFVQYSPLVTTLPDGYTPCSWLVIHSLSGNSPLSTSAPPAHLGSSREEHSFTVHPLANCFQLGRFKTPAPGGTFLRGSSKSSDLARIQWLQSIQAQRTRDQISDQHLDPSIWEDVTVSLASKVLDLPDPSQGNRSNYK